MTMAPGGARGGFVPEPRWEWAGRGRPASACVTAAPAPPRLLRPVPGPVSWALLCFLPSLGPVVADCSSSFRGATRRVSHIIRGVLVPVLLALGSFWFLSRPFLVPRRGWSSARLTMRVLWEASRGVTVRGSPTAPGAGDSATVPRGGHGPEQAKPGTLTSASTWRFWARREWSCSRLSPAAFWLLRAPRPDRPWALERGFGVCRFSPSQRPFLQNEGLPGPTGGTWLRLPQWPCWTRSDRFGD